MMQLSCVWYGPGRLLCVVDMNLQKLHYRLPAAVSGRWCVYIAGFLAFAVFMLSCTPKSLVRLQRFEGVLQQGSFVQIADSLKHNKKLYGKANRFLYYMDVGMLYHYAGEYDSSSSYLLRAIEVHDELYSKSISNEALSLVSNDNVRPYRSKPFELVFAHQVLALNFMAVGDFESALVETRRTQLKFDQWEQDNADKGKYYTDGMFHYLSSIAYDDTGQSDNAMISLFKTIESFQAGAIALAPQIQHYAARMLVHNDRAADTTLLGIDVGEKTDSVHGLVQNAATEIILVGYAGEGPALVEQSISGTYVVDGLLNLQFTDSLGQKQTMTMSAPSLEDVEDSDGLSGRTVHLSFALPAISLDTSATAYFTLHNEQRDMAVQTVVVNDLHAQLKSYLEDTRMSRLSRKVIQVATRTLVAEKTKSKLESDNFLLNLLVGLTTDLVADQLEMADTRGCFFIPHTVQIARLPVEPGTHSVKVVARDARGQPLARKEFDSITVARGEKKVLVYNSFQ